MSRHPQLTALVHRLRRERPRPTLRWSELLTQVRATRSSTKSDRVAQ
jgi:hypothetical protein